MKIIGPGRRSNMDPVDAYRLEQEQRRRQDAADQGPPDVGVRDAPPGTVRKPGGLAGFFGLLSLFSFIATFLSGMLADFLPGDLVWLIPTLFGTTFLFAGLAVFCNMKHPFALLFVAIGAAVAICGLIYGLGSDDIRSGLLEQALPRMLLFVFIAVGAGLVIIPRIQYRRKSGIYTQMVQAKICDKQKHRWRDHNGHYHTGWKLSWSYYIGGSEHVYRSHAARSPERREIGDAGVLLVNPENPDDVWEKAPGAVAILTFIGAIFMFTGMMGMVMFSLAF